ncbi:MAG: hypothetical protein AAF658_10660, partial [Myxococcota bacterium]
VLSLVAAIVGLVVIFWTNPRLIIYGLLGLAAVLGYGALYLIVAAWVDPKRPPAPLPTRGGSDSPTVIEPTDDEPTTARPEVDEGAETVTKMALEDAPTEAAPPQPVRKKRKTTKKKATKKKTTRRKKADNA